MAVFRFRPQFALMMALPTGVLILAGRRRPMVLIGATVVSALSLARVLYPCDTLGSSSSGLSSKKRVCHAGDRVGLLPNALSRVIAFLPPPVTAFARLAPVARCGSSA